MFSQRNGKQSNRENPTIFSFRKRLRRKPKKQYEKFLIITEIFKKYACGIKTHRDKFVVADTRKELEDRLKSFLNGEVTEKTLQKKFRLKDTQTWNIKDARRKLREIGIQKDKFRTCDYRPFCTKWVYLSNVLMDRPRGKEIHNVNSQNPALVTTRQLAYLPFQHAFVANKLADICLISLRTKESSYIFPLYLFKNKKKISNVKDSILRKLKATFDKDVEPIDVFNYIYAVLHSSKFRDKYAQFLKINYPRIPFTSDFKLFSKFADIGQKLIAIHLLTFFSEEESKIGYPIDGTNVIKERRYDEANHRIYINQTQFFEGIVEEEWNFYIGGHQVLDKWLKEMKGKKLSSEDIRYFIKLIASIRETINIMHQLDEHYDKIEKNIIPNKAVAKKLTHYS